MTSRNPNSGTDAAARRKNVSQFIANLSHRKYLSYKYHILVSVQFASNIMLVFQNVENLFLLQIRWYSIYLSYFIPMYLFKYFHLIHKTVRIET